MTATFKIKNFDKLQHYSDRSPPWIKLYNAVLEDYEFTQLSDGERGQLMLIWLLASRSENSLPFDAEWVGRKIGATGPVDLQMFLDKGFILIRGASKPLAKCEREARPEREREEEREERKDSSDFENFWKGYPARPNMSKKKAAIEFDKLTPGDRASATASLSEFCAQLRQDRVEPRFIIHAERYLRDRRFEGFADEVISPERLEEARKLKREREERERGRQ